MEYSTTKLLVLGFVQPSFDAAITRPVFVVELISVCRDCWMNTQKYETTFNEGSDFVSVSWKEICNDSLLSSEFAAEIEPGPRLRQLLTRL